MRTISGLGLAIAFTVAGLAAQGTASVVFVCEHGAAKSVVAAAHFNKRAADLGLPFRAISRGTAPDAEVPGRITEGLKGEGLRTPDGFTPAPVTSRDLTGAMRVITFDVQLPVSTEKARVERWDTLPAFSDGYQPASRAIATKVDALLAELQAAARKK